MGDLSVKFLILSAQPPENRSYSLFDGVPIRVEGESAAEVAR